MESIRVFAPATVANVACAFDVLGFALETPGDELILKKNGNRNLVIKEIKGDNGQLCLDPDQNCVTVAIDSWRKKLGIEEGLNVYLTKKMPLGSGLGSSSASSVAGVFAVNHLFGQPLVNNGLLEHAMEGERSACGSAHADNVGPALFGGFLLIVSYQPLVVKKINYPNTLMAIVVHPHMELKTRDSRNVLPKHIPLSLASRQWGRVGGLIAGLETNDFELISQCLTDEVVEPERAHLIPGFQSVKSSALHSGALGCSISGSGPSVFALAGPGSDPNKIGNAMQIAFRKAGLNSDLIISSINPVGPKIL